MFYLSTNAIPALLVDAFDPSSVQRVYALGHSHHSSGTSYPAPEDRYGPPTLLGALPLRTDRQKLFGALLDQLGTAARHGRDWLVVTLDPAGHLDWYLHPTPHPAPAAEWRTVRLELFGLPGVWPGQIVTNDTHLGWLRPRFTRPVAEQLAAAITAATWLPHLVTPIQLTPDLTSDPADTSHNGIEVVGPDPDGFYRVGDGWHWASLDLLPNGILAPYTGPHQPGIVPAELPAPGQDAFTGLGCLMWLDDQHVLVLRQTYDGGFDPTDPPQPPEYGGLDPDAEWAFRAVEHALRNATTARPTYTGLAAAFTPEEIEALIITAADAAVGAGLDSLSRRQLELAHRAYALLLADSDDTDDTDDEDGTRS